MFYSEAELCSLAASKEADTPISNGAGLLERLSLIECGSLLSLHFKSFHWMLQENIISFQNST